MLKTTITGFAIAATALAMTAAQAADLPARPMYTKAAPAVEMFNWTGFYIGANIGYSSGRTHFSGIGSADLTGVIGGGQIGYNWQIPGGPWVFGVEVDGQGSSEDDSGTFGGVTLTDSLPWFMTARGRIGYLVTPMIMLYGTGGAAIVDHKFTAAAGGASISSEDTRLGWTAGAGIEGMLNRNWSWKVEYLHLDTGSFGSNVLGVLPINLHVTDEIGRVGVNYHF
ncbi:MAG TPA: outer membrane beta-barrel protein [Xanthobacteraceae bacterium]|jgi:outer membrane immunogenic protein